MDFPWEHGLDYEKKMYGIFGFLICRYSDMDMINMIRQCGMSTNKPTIGLYQPFMIFRGWFIIGFTTLMVIFINGDLMRFHGISNIWNIWSFNGYLDG